MPAVYLIIRISEDASTADAREVFRDAWSWIDGQYSYELVDEQFRNPSFDLASVVLKVDDGNALEELARDLPILLGKPRTGVHVLLLESADWHHVEMSDVEVSYFENESVAENPMVSNPDGCVRLLHAPTGAIARCKGYRSRFRNMEGAKALLKALLLNRIALTR